MTHFSEDQNGHSKNKSSGDSVRSLASLESVFNSHCSLCASLAGCQWKRYRCLNMNLVWSEAITERNTLAYVQGAKVHEPTLCFPSCLEISEQSSAALLNTVTEGRVMLVSYFSKAGGFPSSDPNCLKMHSTFYIHGDLSWWLTFQRWFGSF